jgi:hypothetical protein
MVNKTTPKKTAKKAGKNVGGRPRFDPDALRTERLVIRIHPDLMEALTALSSNNGITRSLLVERAMIALVNEQNPGGPILSLQGRRVSTEPSTHAPLGTPDSFRQLWGRVIGGEPALPNAQLPRATQPGTASKKGDRKDDGASYAPDNNSSLE